MGHNVEVLGSFDLWAPDITAEGVRESPKNVIVMTVNYVGGVGVIDSYAELIGSGPVEVFSQGRVERGTWSRANLRHPAIYKNAQGKIINLTPVRRGWN